MLLVRLVYIDVYRAYTHFLPQAARVEHHLRRLRSLATPCLPSTVYWQAYPVYLIQLQNTLCDGSV